MGYAAVKGFSLEIGRAPQLRGVREAADLPSESRHFLLSSSSKGTQVLLQACRSIQALLLKHAEFPEWLVLIDEYQRIAPIADELLQSSERRFADALSKHLASQVVYFYCHTQPNRLSVTEKKVLRSELDSAIELLSSISPTDAPAVESTIDVNSEHRLQLARERRAQLLAEEKWLDAPAVHIQNGGNPDSQGINNTASRFRRKGELLGAWNGREFLHPAFQFSTETGRLLADEVKQLLELLPKDRSGWRQVFWLFQAHARLNGRRPADVFSSDPKSVIDAARSDFEVSDERW